MLFIVEYYEGNDEEDNVGNYLKNLKKIDATLWERVIEYLRMIKDRAYQSGRYWEYIDEGIIEIKHRSGENRSRIYGCFNGKGKIVLLNGELKNGKKQQQKAIQRAKNLKFKLEHEKN